MQYLRPDDLIRINETELRAEAIVDTGLLESAVYTPQSGFGGTELYPTIHEKAAALFRSLVRDHAFVDGNKRTAVIATFTFYRMNGYRVEADQGDVVALALDVAEGQLDVAAISKKLAAWAAPEG